jgi:hypothetical protein
MSSERLEKMVLGAPEINFRRSNRGCIEEAGPASVISTISSGCG